MLLAVDIGNSDITLGLWKDQMWKFVWRMSTKPDLPELYYGIKIRDYFFEVGHRSKSCEHHSTKQCSSRSHRQDSKCGENTI